MSTQDTPSAKQRIPAAIYVWIVPSEEVLDQPGSWRIRKWDTEPFPEANFVASHQSGECERTCQVCKMHNLDFRSGPCHLPQCPLNTASATRESVIDECIAALDQEGMASLYTTAIQGTVREVLQRLKVGRTDSAAKNG